MGFLDKAKEKASHLAEQAKDKLDDVKEKRRVDELLDDLGRIVYRQRTERGEPADEAEIVRLVSELSTLEAQGTQVLAAESAPADEQQPPPAAEQQPPPAAEQQPPPADEQQPPPAADTSSFPEPA